MSELSNCPNCGADLKGEMLGANKLASKNKTTIINLYSEKQADGYCSKCSKEEWKSAKGKLIDEKKKLSDEIKKMLKIVPVISAHSPLGWDYNVLDMVTGQSTAGTGFLTEFTSSFTDLFGEQSGRHNTKIKQGEALCSMQVRMKCLNKGGNAVIATDIDYSEMGGAKAMMMICMAGTAVELKNVDALGEERAEKMNVLVDKNKRYQILNKLNPNE